MRDALYTKRTYRWLIGSLLCAPQRTEAIVAQINAWMLGVGLTLLDAYTFGFVNNGKWSNNGAMNAGAKWLNTGDDALFTPADIGKTIFVQGAGVLGDTLEAVIESYTLPNEVVLTIAAGTTVTPSQTSSSGIVVWGDSAATQLTPNPVLNTAGKPCHDAKVDGAPLAPTIRSLAIPPGFLMWSGSTGEPDPALGWIYCEGQTLDQVNYADLFLSIGTTYNTGGEPPGTFRLPDGRGYFLRGWDDGRGIDPARVFGSTQADIVGPHEHTVPGSTDENFGSNRAEGANNSNPFTYDTTAASGVGTETRPKNIAVKLYIMS